MKELDRYTYDGKDNFKLKDYDTNGKVDKENKEQYVAKTNENLEKIAALQDKFYADGREGLVIALQALDAAGKDSTVKHVMSSVNPQGINVYSFKQPSSEELSHDYLWRVGKCLPARGKIALFNRSYYEDVLVVQVHDLYKGYKLPERCLKKDTKDVFKQRYDDIVNFEKYLYHNGYRVVKIFLHVSKGEQKKRFLERIENPDKNWKFSPADLKERGLWDTYQDVYEDVIAHTATENAPWFVLPADRKWYTRYLISELLVKEFEAMNSAYPKMSEDDQKRLEEGREMLEKEGTDK